MFRTEPLGSPGIYTRPTAVNPVLRSERMDVCAFVGIAPRGPCREPKLPEWWREEEGSYMPKWQDQVFQTRRSIPVAVESFDEYQRLFGGFDGPGRLSYAVSAFFEQGGARAYVVRIVHEYNNIVVNRQGIATGTIPGVSLSNGKPLDLLARNEGTWGNAIRAAIGFTISPVVLEGSDINGLTLSNLSSVPVGSLLLCHQQNAKPALRFVSDSETIVLASQRRQRVTFALPLLEPPTLVEVVESDLLVSDGALIVERHEKLGLSPLHPRWLADQLCYHSDVVYPGEDWHNAEIQPADNDQFAQQAELPDIKQQQFSGGENRYSDLTHADFFDLLWSPAEILPGDGVYAIANTDDIASVLIPDLYCPEPVPDIVEDVPPVSFAGAEFEKCVPVLGEDEEPLELPDINQLCLNPSVPTDLEKIVQLQKQLGEFAQLQKCWVALLDVPPMLRPQQVIAWRGQFDSSYAAAYLPWLYVQRQGVALTARVRLNPSAVAAGIIANREIVKGVHFGPANELAPTVVALDEPLSPSDHDRLHPLGLNAFVMEPDGIRLSAARTLSNNPQLRQLNIRRLMILLKRTLLRQTQWITFEPNGRPLWRQLTHMLNTYLQSLYRAGVFKGASAEEAFFVRCNEQNNTPQTLDAGQLHVEIGVAPAEPTEFIVVKLTHDADTASIRGG